MVEFYDKHYLFIFNVAYQKWKGGGLLRPLWSRIGILRITSQYTFLLSYLILNK